jgi:hypothetical protein
MSNKAPFKRNSAGFWIDSKTGRFAKKSDYLPYLEKETAKATARATKKEAANKARSAATKEYWKDVNKIKDLFGLSTKEARTKLYNTPKYVEKRGHIPKQWSDFWKETKKGNMSKAQRTAYKKRLEEEGEELISF